MQANIQKDRKYFSNLLQRIIQTFNFLGYFLKKNPRKTESLPRPKMRLPMPFKKISGRKNLYIARGGKTFRAERISGPVMSILSVRLLDKPIVDNLGTVFSSVVTKRMPSGLGSGFLIGEDGLIFANEHVVGNPIIFRYFGQWT